MLIYASGVFCFVKLMYERNLHQGLAKTVVIAAEFTPVIYGIHMLIIDILDRYEIFCGIGGVVFMSVTVYIICAGIGGALYCIKKMLRRVSHKKVVNKQRDFSRR